jgi:hypothetical protein
MPCLILSQQITVSALICVSAPELLWHLHCALQRVKTGDVQSMERFATSSSSHSARPNVEWPIVLYWITYLSIVFGILWAFISEGI